MNSVLSKILAREHNKTDVSMVESYNLTDSTDDSHAEADRGSDDDGDLVMNLVAAGGNDVYVSDTSGEDRGGDEDDNLIINIVAGGNSKKSFLDIRDKYANTAAANKHNGCTWKGGKLRLEKAKEHYSARMRHEWAEDTAICRNSEVHNDDNNEEHSTPKKLMKTSDVENIYLQLFFPRLKKIKQIPFKGTGKHKYSFQHIAVPALPSHFCDCEEHLSWPARKQHLHMQTTKKVLLG